MGVHLMVVSLLYADWLSWMPFEELAYILVLPSSRGAEMSLVDLWEVFCGTLSNNLRQHSRFSIDRKMRGNKESEEK